MNTQPGPDLSGIRCAIPDPIECQLTLTVYSMFTVPFSARVHSENWLGLAPENGEEYAKPTELYYSWNRNTAALQLYNLLSGHG